MHPSIIPHHVTLFNSKRETELFSNMKKLSIEEFIQDWIQSLNKGTAQNYSYYMSDLIRKDFIKICTLEEFNSVFHEIVIDKIKQVDFWSETVKQTRCKVYISFTHYLNRVTQGWFRIATPKKGADATFFKIYDKAKTKALSKEDWKKFIESLTRISQRESLIARCLLQGAKRISECLNLKIDDINFDKCQINFTHSKTRGTLKNVPVTYHPQFMQELKEYIESSQKCRDENNWLFVSNHKKRVGRLHVGFVFKKASESAGIGSVTPHMLRTTWVTEALKEGTDPLDMMIVTGHAGLNMIQYYDKRAIEDNVTKKLRMI